MGRIYVEKHKPDKEADRRLQEAARVQKETGISYGEQQTQKALKAQKAYFDKRRNRRVRVGPKLHEAVKKSPFSMKALSRDLGYEQSWLAVRIKNRQKVDMEQLKRICVIIRANPNNMIEED